MIYNVNHTDTSIPSIQISPGNLDKTTTLSLPGKNFTRYGEVIAENFLKLMENFASENSPENPVKGQLWYDTDANIVRVYDGEKWISITANVNDIDNVYYVAENGNDNNTGKSIGDPLKTIDKALEIIRDIDSQDIDRQYTTIFVKSGTYTVDNPVIIPERTAIVGDSLRTVTVKPKNIYKDIFWVKNAAYITQVTFREHRKDPTNTDEDYYGPAAIAFPDDEDGAGVITTSPYIQNCSSITTTGTGMRVDGNNADGLKSMVLDAFTQYNQGGVGVHMINRGNTQLVSLFTICCDKSVWCEKGGFCSLTNSNSSFGNYGLYADGISDELYNATFYSRDGINIFTLKNLRNKPNIGDAIKFESNPNYLTVQETLELTVADNEINEPDYGLVDQEKLDIRSLILDKKEIIQSETINYITMTYPDLKFDLFKCSRDVGYIVDAIVDDMVFETTYLSIYTALSYFENSANKVTDIQLNETLDSIRFVRDYIKSLLDNGSSEYIIVDQNFSIILDILENGPEVAPNPNYTNPPANGLQERINAKNILVANRDFLTEEAIAYRDQNYASIFYDKTEFRKDFKNILNAIIYDTLYGGNSKLADAADEFFKNGYNELSSGEKGAVTSTFNYILSITKQCLQDEQVDAINSEETQVMGLQSLGSNSIILSKMNDLFGFINTLITEGYTCQIFTDEQGETFTQTDDETGFVNFIDVDYKEDEKVSFHQYSLIIASGHTFEWVGAGTDVNTALPYLGGVPINENRIIQENNGKVYYTGTDQRGDFRIGEELTINRTRGTIEGRVFRRSLYQILTPYILALQE